MTTLLFQQSENLFGKNNQLTLPRTERLFYFEIISIKWNLNLLVITFSTTLTPLARVVSRNDASPSDGDNKRLVCARGDANGLWLISGTETRARFRHFHKWLVEKILGQRHRATLQNYKTTYFAFDQRESEVNLHKTTSSPESLHPL
jgi:hypothetical protein